jgi:transcriptional regulator with XRE-family HTH domain
MNINLGQQLREIRDKRGFPQKVIAAHLGLHRTNYSRIENNLQKLTPEQIKLFCEFCDVSADYLLGIHANNKVVFHEETIDSIESHLNEIRKIIKK